MYRTDLSAESPDLSCRSWRRLDLLAAGCEVELTMPAATAGISHVLGGDQSPQSIRIIPVLTSYPIERATTK
jgi:hypothetical protein